MTGSELDRERASEYNITVTCSDEGVPSLASSVTLTLQISDVNDNAPVFERRSYEAYIVENNTPGFSIFTVKATDADWNQNARVSYILEDSSINGVPVSSYVSVSADSGVIHAVRSFDYEQIKDFQFRIKAQDGGSPPLSSNVTVKILIQDQNDNPPQVLYPVQTGGSVVAEMVPRSADVGYLVTKVVAVDVDTGQNAWLSFKLQKATDRALFEVGLQNGEIRTIRQVTDKDAVKQRLTVIVEDNGQPSRSATVIVNVAVADSFPEVLSEFTDFPHDKEYNDNLTFYLVLALAVVSFLFITCLVVIISVKIYRWRQSRILYHSSLPVIPYYPPRYSDTLGTGTLPHVYNYEVCRTTDSRKSDNKFEGAGSQNVLIMDPSSTGTMQRIQSEKSILDEPDSPLEVNNQGDGSENIEMVLNAPLDREKNEHLSLILMAVDGGESQMTGTMQILINVLDFNDNAPLFTQPVYKAFIKEDETIGTAVCKVSATDADKGANAQITYSISAQDHALFNIDKRSGEVTLNGKTDYEKAKNYQVIIRARDDGGLTGSCKLIVDIIDVNDNRPDIHIMSKSNLISEDAKPNTVVTIINVEDADSSENGKVHCVINDNDYFILRSTSEKFYSLMTGSELDRERASEYNITVTCSDEGVPSLASSVTLTLQISDVNDNAPVFERRSYEAYIVENNTPGFSIFTVKATDADWNQNARVSYILEDSSVNGVPVSSYVSVSADSGVIHAVRSFDYEQIKDFQFRVKAQDGGSPPLSSNVTVKILIQDQNDNPPQVLYPVQTGGSVVAEMVPRSADVGYLVTKVVAVDVDSGQNAWLSYKLQKATDRALFEVGLQNGEIRTIRQVTDKDAVKQRLTVIVEDNGQPSRSATVIVNVAVADSFPEVLSEFTDFPHDKEYNDNLTFYLVLALAVVSFLFITCLVVIISVKIYRWRQSRILYHSSLPVIPYYPPRYSDTLGTGTLPHVYNYEVCRTTDSRKSDNKFEGAGNQNVLIMDPSSTGTMQRMQSVKNILDEPDSPVEVSYSIPEEMPTGSLVGNIAKDFGVDIKRLKSGKARIFSRDTDKYIELHKERGVLLIKNRIDREALCGQMTPCALHFQIILENPMEFYSVTVEITDINDNPPSFEKSEVKFKISESAVRGAKFILDRAVDLDVGVNGLHTYKLEPKEHFVIKLNDQADGSKNVEMILETPLDREKQERLSLVLTALDGGEPQMTGTMQILITVLDANDNAPVFTQSVYMASIRENSPVGTVVMAVTATDADEGSNGRVTYSISSIIENARGVFEVNAESGEITLRRNVDYEKAQSFQMNIRASDDGSLGDSCKVMIDVKDVNDNKPNIQIISKSNVITEDAKIGTVVTMINIEDADSGDNGKVQCSINENIPFVMKSSTGDFFSLITDSELDRERASEYNITVTCSDEGVPSLSSSVTLTLQISDVNDNAPVFERSSYEAYIVENNTPGLSIFTVKATDADWNQNARVSYILEDSSVNGVPVSSYVSVSADSGVIHAVRSFDYEQIKDFQFRIKAQDGGSPPLSSNVTVKVLIKDQNDNPPQVLYPVQTGGSVVAEMVPRSADVGYLVTKVVAVDVDSGQNAWLSYKLQKATDRALFEVGLQNGEIRTIRQVTDKDAVKQRLTVIVEDNGQPSRSATVIVNVAVADSFPEVLSEFTDFPHDKEYNDNLTFYLVLALAVVSFLFITCLVVIISVKIYRWRQSRILYHSSLPVIPYYPPRYSDTLGTGTLPHVYNYEVCRTTDSRKSDNKFEGAGNQNVLIMDPSSTGTMQRMQSVKNILDEPDSPVEDNVGQTMRGQVLLFFSVLCLCSALGQVSYSIPEEMPTGSLVGNIAKDFGVDIKRLKSGKARIFSRDTDKYIELHKERGVLLIKNRIDREALCGQMTPCALHFQIILENPMEFYSVTVEITDINDNPPSFEKSEVKFKISESAVRGAKFILDRAVDLDVGVNGLHTYKLEPKEHFVIKLNDQADGSKNVEMILETPLDREKQERLSLVLTALDGGEPQMTGTMQILITVLDANDNAPVFTQSVYMASIRENSPVGTVVMAVTATDADEGSNGRVTYSISSIIENARGVFEVNAESGEITLRRNVDYEKAQSFQMNIRASDDGSLGDSCKVMIDVKDVNDNKPNIQIISKSNVITEDAKIGTVVTMINIEDADSGDNGKVQCSINENIPFVMKSSTGDFFSLITDSELDRERASEYNITVTCSDEGVPSLSSSVTLTLQISDVNDNAPVFERSSYEAYIVENNTPGLSIFTVKATDADWNQNARVSYILEDSSVNGVPVSSYVSVSADSGVIHAVRSFDYEQIKDFQFRIKAQDGGSPPLSSNVTVKVLIKDQNDNPPQVLYPVQTGGSVVAEMVPRSADVGYLVTKVVAVDVDSGQNAWLSYKLQKATDRALFEVGLQNGEIRTIRQVTDKDAVKQRLTVIVEDNGQPSRSATVIVNVAVADSFPEVLSEFTDFPHDKEYNDNLTFYLLLALAVVSFLFITCLVVIISVKIYRWRQSRILYHSSLPVIPYYPPRYSDTLGTGTLPHVYNYEVCRTTDSRKSDNKFGGAGSQNVLIMDSSSTGTMQRIQSEKNILDEPDSPLEKVDIFPWWLQFLCVCVAEMAVGQVRYSIPEEMSTGSVVGNIIQDLGLDVKRLRSGRARIFTEDGSEYIGLNREKGTLVSFFTAFVSENNSPGMSLLSVKASDKDHGNNARISYFLEDNQVNGMSASSYFSVNAESGEVVAVRSFDYEQLKEFNIRVKAQDGGSPPLSSNVTVKILIQDQNDNPPQVLYPVQTGGSVVAEMVPRSADVGYLVTKVVAVDVDSGQNAWLSYKLQKATDRALFEVGLQNGEIRTIRQVTDKDAVKQRLTVIVEDNGQPSRSATVIVNVAVADSFPEVLSEFTDFPHDKEYNDNLTFYLVLALAVVSFLFITCLVVIISVKIYRWRQEQIFYKSNGNLPVIPYYPPLYADAGGSGTLKQGFGYEVYGTTDSRMSDVKGSRPFGENTLSVDHSVTRTMPRLKTESENILTEAACRDRRYSAAASTQQLAAASLHRLCGAVHTGGGAEILPGAALLSFSLTHDSPRLPLPFTAL
ncbi:hypothetical protein CRENBAI_021533 [Crenichthys baileyi]|uniref:Cadherin domain-containing protein n=1 Tax=Crenichthys baileyi TaxID=28760 RepID=A0AAV9R2M9_9TELE